MQHSISLPVLQIVQNGLVFSRGDVFPLRFVVLERFDGFGGAGLSCLGISAHARSA